MNTNDIKQAVAEVVQDDSKQVVRSVSLFGSQLSGSADAQSDVDLLVELEENADLFDVGRLQYELEKRLARPVDVVTPNSLSKYFRQQVLNQAVKIYG